MNNDYKSKDASDVLASSRQKFSIPDNTIYLDGNSLGALPNTVQKRVSDVTQNQWGRDLIASWNSHGWIHLSQKIGDRIGNLVGASAGQLVCADSISVNLFKALAMAIELAAPKRAVLTTEDNFPTDIYMVQGLQDLVGQKRCELRMCDENDLLASIDDDTAVVMVTQVNFRTGRILPVEEIVAKAKEHGALVILDLAHSAGVLPVHLDDWNIDFAVGCTYKYLNAGPGAPAFIYANQHHHKTMNQPLYGWMGHAAPFAFSNEYRGASDATQMLVGTPPIISMSAVDAALDVYDDVTIAQIRTKSEALSEYFLDCLQAFSTTDVLQCISPLDVNHRGSQLSFAFEHAYALCQALIERGVIADFRAPNYIRFGFAPLYNSFQDISIAVQHIDEVLKSKVYLDEKYQTRQTVT
jgi:kynureninase